MGIPNGLEKVISVTVGVVRSNAPTPEFRAVAGNCYNSEKKTPAATAAYPPAPHYHGAYDDGCNGFTQTILPAGHAATAGRRQRGLPGGGLSPPKSAARRNHSPYASGKCGGSHNHARRGNGHTPFAPALATANDHAHHAE